MDQYEIVKLLYKNSYGEILKVVKSNEPFIFKIVKNYNSLSTEAIKESVLLAKLNHPHIICLYETYYLLQKSIMVLEYADMDLKCYMNAIVPSDKDIKNIMLQICLGLRHCHEQYIIHRDLKPQNILVQFKSYGLTIKIADFGLAIEQIIPKKLSFNVVSLWYRAPEIILQKDYNDKIDVWSLGCIFYELVTNKVLFAGTEETQLSVILNTLYKIKIKDGFIKKMLKINPSIRSNVENLLYDDYFFNDCV